MGMAETEFEQIRYEVQDRVATITLARPNKLNAFTVRMMDEMIAALDLADADDGVGAIIFTGDGRAFCAGADLGDGAKSFDASTNPDSPIRPDGSIDYASQYARDYAGRLTLRIFNCLKPVVSAINGPAVGVGATMLLAMDVRIASEEARFGFVFARRGIVAEGASSWFLPRIVGISTALDWTMSGRLFDASEAYQAGLVSSVVAQDLLLDAARERAASMFAQSAPVSVALTRQMMWRGLGMSHPMEAHRIDSRGILSRGISADTKEGVQAFLEKREARFPDRVSTDMPDFFPWWDEPEYC